MIWNQEYVIMKSRFNRIEELPEVLESETGGNLLRWYISRVSTDGVHVETTRLVQEVSEPEGVKENIKNAVYPGKCVVLSVVPTGIGCDIGGYAADAAPSTALLASCTDYLITNPNAVNASDFIFMEDNVLYTEGYMIDLFCKGLVNLYQPYSNKVGLIIEKTGKEELEILFNIINTTLAVHGVNLHDYVITDELIEGRCQQTSSGSYVGGIENPWALFKACEYLIQKGINAIAITSNIKDLPLDNYAEHFDGRHPNPLGGAEAVISHLVCKKYKIPAAHAPMINMKEMKLKNRIVDARGAGEYSSTSGLACILIGLNHAPQVSRQYQGLIKDVVNINNLLAVVTPASALGGIPMLYAARYGIPIIAVKENRTILDLTYDKLKLHNVIVVNNYPEAAGVIKALRKGISIASLYRPLKTLRF
jgi:hypothetical protein